MPLIQISILEGRTDEQIRELVREVTDATVRTIDACLSDVSVIVTQVPRSHWGEAGVTLAQLP